MITYINFVSDVTHVINFTRPSTAQAKRRPGNKATMIIHPYKLMITIHPYKLHQTTITCNYLSLASLGVVAQDRKISLASTCAYSSTGRKYMPINEYGLKNELNIHC